jgi:exonuclease III
VYLPHEPTQRKNYILNTLNPLIQTIPKTDNIILMGDFNIISNPHLDHIGGQITSGRTGNTELNKITTQYSLIDTWRHLHPDQRGFT